MSCTSSRPYSDLAVFQVEAAYRSIGCDSWDRRKVMLLCAKFGDTPRVMAARLRLRPAEFERRMMSDVFTKQDGLILTFLEREIDLAKGGIPPPAIIPPGIPT